ncbi:unnamed protein product [Orchesella dallaii]|uniref:Uncharacterized protein n=1 Tax=Orchesella dallaii TaxID=48710 RepID=A0ABP1Q917_9HEXA
MEPVGSKLENLFQLIRTLSSGLKSVLFVRILWARQEFLLDFVNRTFCNFKVTTSYWKISLLIGYMIITCASSLSPGNENEFIDKLLSLTSTSSLRADWWFEPFRVFGLSTYDDVKCTVNNVNDFMGDLVFAFYLETLTYFAETTGVLAAEPQYLETVIFIVFLALFVYIWFLACEFHRKVNDITVKWIANCQAGQNISMDQRLRLNALSNENRDAQLGISCRFFTVTYSFIGSMLSLIITYGIIVLQTRT